RRPAAASERRTPAGRRTAAPLDGAARRGQDRGTGARMVRRRLRRCDLMRRIGVCAAGHSCAGALRPQTQDSNDDAEE
ncbi:MAG: hypothetical protein ACK58X_00620, partial [Planctomycetota bacterium]